MGKAFGRFALVPLLAAGLALGAPATPASAQRAVVCEEIENRLSFERDRVRLGPRDDVLTALRGADSIHGGGGDDLLNGARDGDVVKGGPGDDILCGGSAMTSRSLWPGPHRHVDARLS